MSPGTTTISGEPPAQSPHVAPKKAKRSIKGKCQPRGESIRYLDQQFLTGSRLSNILDVLGDGLHHLQIGKFPASRPDEVRLHLKELFLHFLLPVFRIKRCNTVLVQENQREIIQRPLVAVQCPVVNFLLKPFRDRGKLMPVDQAFLA